MERQDITTGEPGDGNRFAVIPEKKPKERQKDFFALWSVILEACGESADDAPIDRLCDEIFRNEYTDGKESVVWLFEELEKIGDEKLRGTVMDSARNLAEKTKYFYVSVGFALGRDYEVTRPEAKKEIDYLRKRIHESGILPLVARR